MKFADTAIRNFFPTPFVICRFAEGEQAALNATLIQMVMARAGASAGVKISNAGGWQSDDRILEWGGEPVRQLMEAITAMLGDITLIMDQGMPKRDRIDWRIAGWANINRQGHSNVAHDHPGAYWSAVYYVQTDNTDPMGGELELLDPRGSLPLFYAPNLRMGIKGYTTAGMSELYKPQAGDCVIFPSWLKHAVTRSIGSGDRISLAFNFSV